MLEITNDLWQVVVRTAVIYLVVLLGLRLLGKREIGQLTPFDLVLLLLISNAVQNAMTGPNVSLWGGLLSAATLLLINWFINWTLERFPRLRKAVEGQPTILLSHGKVLLKNMKKEQVSLEELEMAAREHGIADLKGVELAVLEMDGSISIIPFSEHHVRVKRPLRYLRHR